MEAIGTKRPESPQLQLLTSDGIRLGLVDAARRAHFESKIDQIDRGMKTLAQTSCEGVPGNVYLRRNGVDWQEMCDRIESLNDIGEQAAVQCLYDVKYEGYVNRQKMEVERQKRMSEKKIPSQFDYRSITSMRNEAREKLSEIRPLTLDQAQRISGITPADIALLLAHLESGSAR